MKSNLIIISGFFLCSEFLFASTIESNPFITPSKRILEVENINLSKDIKSNEALIKEMASQLILEEKLKEPPEFRPEVLGEWTKEEVLESKYIGNTNGVKVYFNPRLNQYIYLDMKKVKK